MSTATQHCRKKYIAGACVACLHGVPELDMLFQHGVLGNPLCGACRSRYVMRLRELAAQVMDRPAAQASPCK